MPYIFFLTCIAFATTAFIVSRRATSDEVSFRTRDPGLNVVGLVTANITAGTGFVYLLLNGAKNGLLACAIPLALWLGYRVLVSLLNGIPDHLFKPNFLGGVAHALSQQTGARSALPFVLIAPLLIVFVLVLGFEMFATSQLLGAVIFHEATVFQQIMISVVLFATTMIVVVWGGEATFKTDRVQAIFIVLCLIVLVCLAWVAWQQDQNQHVDAFMLKYDAPVLFTLAFASLAAFNTQIYSILNWNAVANATPDKRNWVLLTSGKWLAVFVGLVLLIGASMPRVWSGAFQLSLATLLKTLSQPVALGASIIIIIGITSIVLTTTQGVTLAIGAFLSELRGDLNSTQSLTLSTRRIQYGAILLLVMGVLGLIYFQRPDLFYFLLAIVSGAEVMMPLIILLMVLAKRGRAIGVCSNKHLYGYLALFCIAIVTNIVLSMNLATLVPYVSLTLVTISVIYSWWLYSISKRLQA